MHDDPRSKGSWLEDDDVGDAWRLQRQHQHSTVRVPRTTTMKQARLIHLERDEDVSGISGTGVVAYGAEFPDGTIVLRWDTKVRSTVIYDSLSDLSIISGHGGRTRIVYDS